jgi:NAD(P)-dependent dehydrogenase (short-subunit alcohol dehydrogenase family)
VSSPHAVGRTVVLTGATNGIGLESSLQLAAQGHRLVLVGRNPEKLAAVAGRVSAAGADAVDTVVADHESLASVRSAAARIAEVCPRVDVLVNNAGTVYDQRKVTDDGYEATWQVNHLSGFLLTELLRDRLVPGSRVVITSSTGHHQGTMDLDDVGFERGGYGIMRAYSRSKLANVLHTRWLARELEPVGVTVNCLHPGAVATDIWSGAPWFARPVLAVAKRFMRSPADGGARLTYLATDPAVEGESGGYYAYDRLTEPSDLARDDTLGEQVRDLSRQQVGLA